MDFCSWVIKPKQIHDGKWWVMHGIENNLYLFLVEGECKDVEEMAQSVEEHTWNDHSIYI